MRSLVRQALTPLLLALVLFPSTALSAQEAEPEPSAVEAGAEETLPAPPAASTEAAEIPAAAERPSSGPASERTGEEWETRNNLVRLLRTQRPGLGSTLAFRPALLSDASFLAEYPELARFLDAHPEVRREPSFYLAGYHAHRRSSAEDLVEVMAIFVVFLAIALALAWAIRTFIEQKRWKHLARTQTEVHNKIIDRFGSSEELLEYVRSPAGTRFLEAAPIPVHTDDHGGSPQSRIVRSVQIGVMVAIASLAVMLVSGRFDEEGAQVLFTLGVIALAVGVGFVASAGVSFFLSRRLGLWEAPPARGVDGDAADRLVP